MAFYRLEAKIIAREGRGRSVISASAYRSGTKLKDERYNQTHDYTRREKGVVKTTLLYPEKAPEWAKTPESLWNFVEAQERRKDSQLAREFVLAVPHELSADQQFQLALGWAQSELVNKGMIIEASLHHSKSGKNPHIHILCTMRRLDGDKFSAKKARDWDDKVVLRDQRETWGQAVNAALEKAGRPERVDHRSLKAQGIDRIPQPKIGVAATAMKRRGLVADPERFQLVRFVKQLNATRPFIRAIKQLGEVRQRGMGKNWWERSLIYAAGTKETVKDTARNLWGNFRNSKHRSLPRMAAPEKNGPEITR